MIRTYVDVLLNMLPIFASIIIFAVFVAIEGEDALTPAKVYTVLSIFNLIASPLRMLVNTVITFMNARASLQRVDHFLDYEEKNDEGINNDNASFDKGQIHLDNCKFNWETEKAKQHFEDGKKLYSKNKTDEKKSEKKEEPKKKKKSGDGTKKKKKKVTKKKKKSVLT